MLEESTQIRCLSDWNGLIILQVAKSKLNWELMDYQCLLLLQAKKMNLDP